MTQIFLSIGILKVIRVTVGANVRRIERLVLFQLQVQTPPDSNKSMEDSRCVGRCVRPEELSKMFPTPPSLEAHAQPSPGFSLPDDTPAHHPHHTHLSHAAHAAHRLLPGSPPPDAIEVRFALTLGVQFILST